MSAKAVRLVSITVALLGISVATCSYGQSSVNNGGSGTISDQDRLLLEKIDRLERRIIELEARAGIEPTKQQSDSPASASGKLNQDAPQSVATQVADPSATSVEAEAPF